MDDVALANYVLGIDHGLIEAGRVDAKVSALLGVPAGTPIWFSEYTLQKLKERHGENTFQHYYYMPKLLLTGFAARSLKPKHIELWWVDSPNTIPPAFIGVLKVTKAREVFVATFHPLHLRQARRMARKAKREGRLVRLQVGHEHFLKS